jgi:hypothetical protein
MEGFGIYVLTYPGDFHLSIALINSLKNFHPDIPIVIIPGEGFDLNDHPFDEPVMSEPQGFWGKMKHADRKCWVFQGEFEKFLYLDADLICTRSIAPLIDRIMEQEGKFIFVQEETGNSPAWTDAISNDNHERHDHCIAMVWSQLGNPDYIQSFDKHYDPYNRYPFNTGIFASNIHTISESEFEDLNNRERDFYKRHLGKEFSWKMYDLFFGDQGRINYLISKLNVPVFNLYPDGHFLWGGTPAEVEVNDVLNGDVGFSFIHWAGCPRPSPSIFCKGFGLSLLRKTDSYLKEGYEKLYEIPGYSVWLYFLTDAGNKGISLQDKFVWSRKDIKKIVKSEFLNCKAMIKSVF